VTGVWVAGATLATYWGLTIVSFLLRALNDPTTDVADAVLTRLGWRAYPTVGAVIVAQSCGVHPLSGLTSPAWTCR
jgi:hypothetical protein